MTRAEDRLLTQHLVSAWQSGIPLTAAQASGLAPENERSAYMIQRQVADALGWFPTGRARAWKVASRPLVAAPVPETFIKASPAHFDPADAHTVMGVEVELALELANDLNARCSLDEAASAIGRIIAAIELFDVRARDWATLPPYYLLADQQMHGRLIVGSGIEGPWNEHYADKKVSVFANGQCLQSRLGGHPLGSPLEILPWLARHVAAHGDGLKVGDLIASGSWTRLYLTCPGEQIKACFDGIGEVELNIIGA